jgi:predicted site-specific integrase-resolvase
MSQAELAQRWGISPRTLERWRWIGHGPKFLKLGGRVVYRMQDVEAYEAAQLRSSTTDESFSHSE